MSGGAETAQATIRVWMRFRAELNASSRLEVLSGPYKGQVLNIIGPPVANATGTRLEILCKTGAEKMIETSLDFSGLNDIAKDLEALSRAENNKVLRDATRAGAEVLKEEVIARAPVRTGKLKKNVVVVTQKSRRRGEISSGVHIRGVNPRTGNSDNTMKANNPRNAFYWRFVELGTANMPAHPFVRPAYDTREEEAASVAIARMNQAIDEVLSK